jgi:hypothetical protein
MLFKGVRKLAKNSPRIFLRKRVGKLKNKFGIKNFGYVIIAKQFIRF